MLRENSETNYKTKQTVQNLRRGFCLGKYQNQQILELFRNSLPQSFHVMVEKNKAADDN